MNLALALSAPAAMVSAGQIAPVAHADPVTAVILALAVILVGAKLGGDIATRLRQPAVLGELLAGMLLGNLNLAGIRVFDFIATNEIVDALAKLGVLILLFEVGLESTVPAMMRVGLPSLLVAVLGVIAPSSASGGESGLSCCRNAASTSTRSSARRSPRPASGSPPGCSRTWVSVDDPRGHGDAWERWSSTTCWGLR